MSKNRFVNNGLKFYIISEKMTPEMVDDKRQWVIQETLDDIQEGR